jgi:hypothetical protein
LLPGIEPVGRVPKTLVWDREAAIASNQSFSGWTDTFTDPRLCATIIDRLTFNVNDTIIETGTRRTRLPIGTKVRPIQPRARAGPSSQTVRACAGPIE